MLLTELCERYARRKLVGANPKTAEKYLIAIHRYGKFLGHDPTDEDFDDEVILAWAWSIVREGKSIDTASMYHSKLLCLWRYAAGRGLVKLAPDHEKLKTPKRAPLAWNQEQLRKLFEACENAPGFVGGLPASNWWQTFHSCLWDSGERLTPILVTRWEHIDLDSRWLFVPAENRKGRAGDARYRLHPRTVEALREFQWPRRDRVWPFPYCRNTIWNRYRRLLESAGLPTGRKRMFHCLRKSVASWYELAGGDSTRLLGHSSRSVTINHYLDETIVSPPQPCDLLFRPGQPSGHPG